MAVGRVFDPDDAEARASWIRKRMLADRLIEADASAVWEWLTDEFEGVSDATDMGSGTVIAIELGRLDELETRLDGITLVR